ncbi:hypothetical protein HDU97_000496 [Phlyctochytrium planicorne]|nr:hypothetical protein HDU97_000496 [Phlyctochytrium planicorne]
MIGSPYIRIVNASYGPDQADQFPIRIDTDDIHINPLGLSNYTMPFSRSAYLSVDTSTNNRILANVLTPFLDGSGLYGHTDDYAASMRTFSGGLLKSQNLSTGEFPPYGNNGYFAFQRDEINISPYLPVLLGEPLPPYTGYNDSVNPQIDVFFVTVALRYGHSAISQLVMRYEENGDVSDDGHLLIRNCVFAPNIGIVGRNLEGVLRGMAVQREQLVDTNVVEDMTDFFVLNGNRDDLAATDIQRGRDVGLPDYNRCREAFGLRKNMFWSDVTKDEGVQAVLKSLYGDIGNLDPIVGAMAEDHMGTGVIGPLFAASIKEQFIRIRDGDRFWFENPGVLDADEKRELSNIFLGDVIKLNTKIRNFPSNPFRTTPGSIFQRPSVDSKDSGSGYVSTIEIFGVLRLSWNVRVSDNIVDFVFESNATGWYGMGFGSGMVNSDVYLVTKDGNGTLGVTDRWSTGPGLVPQLDVQLSGSSSLFNIVPSPAPYSFYSIGFSRKLVTNDPKDVDIINAPMDMMFAFNPTTFELKYHEGNRGVVTVNLFEKGMLLVVGAVGASISLKVLHGFSMFFAFAFVYPVGIFVARYYTDMNRWVELHASLMTTVTTNVLITALTAIIGRFGELDFIHVRIGLVVVLLVGSTSALGYLSSMVEWRFLQPYMKTIRSSHRFLGFVTYLLGVVNGYFGSIDIQYGDDSKAWIKWTYLSVIATTPIFLVMYGEYHKRSQKVGKEKATLPRKRQMMNEMLPVFHWEDVHQRVSLGAKWMVIDNIIYDVEHFIPKHPGGPGYLRNAVGMDVTKIFYGVHSKRSLDRGMSLPRSSLKPTNPNPANFYENPHRHSRFAKYLLANMAVGRLRTDEDNTVSHFAESVHSSNKSKTNTLPRPGSPDELLIGGGGIGVGTAGRRHEVVSEQFQNFALEARTLLTGNGARNHVYRFRFKFDDPNAKLKVKPGQSILFQFVDENGKVVTRSYTPLRSENEGGVDFFIKVYGGEMTRYLVTCKSVRMRGPVAGVDILNRFSDSGCWKTLGLIAGGTGLSPMLLLIDYHLRYGSRDPITNAPLFKIYLLVANTSDLDMFGQDLIDELERSSEGALTVTYLIKFRSGSSNFGLHDHCVVGDLCEEVIVATMPKPPPLGASWAGFMSRPRPLGEIGARESQSGDNISSRTNSNPRPRSFIKDDNSSVRFSHNNPNILATSVMREEQLAHKRRRSFDETHRSLRRFAGGDMRAGPDGDAVDVMMNMAIVVCGPTMMNIAVSELLRQMNYPPEVIITL